MPTELPSHGGFTTTGRGSGDEGVSRFARPHAAVGMAFISSTILVLTLSIAICDACTPGPVYGIFLAFRAACTPPFSPQPPCSAMYTASIPSGRPSRLSSFRSIGNTSYFPRLARASATVLPEASDTSRSLDLPPITTAIFFIRHIIAKSVWRDTLKMRES